MSQIQIELTDKEYLRFNYDYSYIRSILDWVYETYSRGLVLNSEDNDVDLLINYRQELVCNIRYDFFGHGELMVIYYINYLKISDETYNQWVHDYIQLKEDREIYIEHDIDLVSVLYVKMVRESYNNTLLRFDYNVEKEKYSGIDWLKLGVNINLMLYINNLYVSELYDEVVSVSSHENLYRARDYGTIHWENKWWISTGLGSTYNPTRNVKVAEFSNKKINRKVSYALKLEVNIYLCSLKDLYKDVCELIRVKEVNIDVSRLSKCRDMELLDYLDKIVEKLFNISNSVSFFPTNHRNTINFIDFEDYMLHKDKILD